MLTPATIDRRYRCYKRLASAFLRLGNTEAAAGFIELAAQVGYTFMRRYADDALEDLLERLSRRIVPTPLTVTPTPHTVVFYDSFAYDNRGLSYQYLRALHELGYTLHVLVPHTNIGPHLKTYLEEAGIPVTTLDEPTLKNRVRKGLAVVEAVQPTYLFQHLSPNDATGCCLSLSVTGCQRCRINLTDHAYWMGTRASDTLFEFRRYGAWLSHHHRGLPLEASLLQPYYPQVSEHPFQGFPAAVTPGKVLLFAGGTFYKFYGRDHRFLNLVRRVLDANPEALMLLAGDGEDGPLRAFIDTYQLGDRIILLGNRRDISAVFDRIDIYLNTYPMIGGLMSQLAAIHHKPVIGYTEPALYSFNDIEDLMDLPREGHLVVDDEDRFLEQMHRLITDPAYRSEQAERGATGLPTPDTFRERLASNLAHPTPVTPAELTGITVDLETLADVYLDMENHYIHAACYLFWIKPLKLLLRRGLWVGR